MSKVKIATVNGYTKEEALATSNVAVDVKFDATTAYKKAGSPTGTHLIAFCEDYLEKKIKSCPGIGCSITVEAGVADNRERPYKVDNVVTDGARKYETVYQGVVKTEIVPGLVAEAIVFTDYSKSDAEETAKQFVTDHNIDVTVKLAKEVTEGQEIAMVVRYTPSVNTKLGTYIAFGYEA